MLDRQDSNLARLHRGFLHLVNRVLRAHPLRHAVGEERMQECPVRIACDWSGFQAVQPGLDFVGCNVSRGLVPDTERKPNEEPPQGRDMLGAPTEGEARFLEGLCDHRDGHARLLLVCDEESHRVSN